MDETTICLGREAPWTSCPDRCQLTALCYRLTLDFLAERLHMLWKHVAAAHPHTDTRSPVHNPTASEIATRTCNREKNRRVSVGVYRN